MSNDRRNAAEELDQVMGNRVMAKRLNYTAALNELEKEEHDAFKQYEESHKAYHTIPKF